MIDPAMPLDPYSKGFFDWVVGHLASYRRFLEGLDRQTMIGTSRRSPLEAAYEPGAGTESDDEGRATPVDSFDSPDIRRLASGSAISGGSEAAIDGQPDGTLDELLGNLGGLADLMGRARNWPGRRFP